MAEHWIVGQLLGPVAGCVPATNLSSPHAQGASQHLAAYVGQPHRAVYRRSAKCVRGLRRLGYFGSTFSKTTK